MQTKIVSSALQDQHFFFLKDGDNYVIILSEPYSHVAHYGRDVGGNVRKLNCSKTSDCPSCIAKHDTSTRWFFKIFDVRTLSVKLLDACYSIVEQLGPIKDELHEHPINIMRIAGNPCVRYEVVLLDKKLSAKDTAKIEAEDVNFDMVDIARPRTVAEITARLRGD